MGKTRTDEIIKIKIFSYLDDAAKNRSWKIEDFTLVSICKKIGVEEERVKKILDNLSDSERELIKVKKIDADIYLPTHGSEKIEKSLQMKKLTMAVSPYAAFFIVISAVWVLATVNNTLTIDNILFITLFLGLPSAYLMQWLSKEFIKWKVTSEKAYKNFIRLSRFSIYLIILLASFIFGYYAISWLIGSEMILNIVGGVVVAVVNVIIAKIADIIWKWS